MHLFLSIIVHTSNLLGVFSDPFEFEGDYGEHSNSIRKKVFESVMGYEAMARHGESFSAPTSIATFSKVDDSMAQAMVEDSQYGPTLEELVDPDLFHELYSLQEKTSFLGFSKDNLDSILTFIDRYSHVKIFRFFRHAPLVFLHLDWQLRAQAAKTDGRLNLPILSSTKLLTSTSAKELKTQLLQSLFTAKTIELTMPEGEARSSLDSISSESLSSLLGEAAQLQDLEPFCSPIGQMIFYWLYQSLNLHLISANPHFIDEINQVKENVADSIGNPQFRSGIWMDKLTKAQTDVLFTQECDAIFAQEAVDNGLFHPIRDQNPNDGCFIFLKKETWEPDYQIIPLDDYPGSAQGKINLILATHRETRERFLLASCHGHSTKPKDGREQITRIKQKYNELSALKDYSELQLVIGIDANTKAQEDCLLFRELLDSLSLIATSVGPTTIKKRMVTAQHQKAGVFAAHEEDYLITLKQEVGGRYLLTEQTLGFKEGKADLTVYLPNIENPSDHYAVGAVLKPIVNDPH